MTERIVAIVSPSPAAPNGWGYERGRQRARDVLLHGQDAPVSDRGAYTADYLRGYDDEAREIAEASCERGRQRGIAARNGGASPIPVMDRDMYLKDYLRGYDEVMTATWPDYLRDAEQSIQPAAPTDPLDAVIDGRTLRTLLEHEELNRRVSTRFFFTSAQRAAVSAHWSAQLRAKVAASEAERRARAPSVMMSIDPEDV